LIAFSRIGKNPYFPNRCSKLSSTNCAVLGGLDHGQVRRQFIEEKSSEQYHALQPSQPHGVNLDDRWVVGNQSLGCHLPAAKENHLGNELMPPINPRVFSDPTVNSINYRKSPDNQS